MKIPFISSIISPNLNTDEVCQDLFLISPYLLSLFSFCNLTSLVILNSLEADTSLNTEGEKGKGGAGRERGDREENTQVSSYSLFRSSSEGASFAFSATRFGLVTPGLNFHVCCTSPLVTFNIYLCESCADCTLQ